MADSSDDKYFSVWDYVVCSAMLLLSIAFGIYSACSGRCHRTADEFLLGSRQLSVIPVALSITVSFMSAINVIGTPVDVYIYNTMFWWIIVAYFVGGILVCRLFVPLYFELQIVSAYEYLELRFSKTVRLCCTFLFFIQMMTYMGVAMYTPAMVVQAVTGFNLWACVGITGIVSIFYTTIGGMKAVVWTDALQALIILLGILAVIIKGSMRVGGLGEVWRIAQEGERVKLAVISFDPTVRHTVWSVVVGMIVIVVSTSGTNQSIVQRYISCGSKRRAYTAIMLATIFKVITVSLCVISGLVMYALYSQCDPYSQGKISKIDQLTPYFVMDLFANIPGLPGLFISAILSASLSSLSSGINSLAAVTGEDIIKSFWPNIEAKRYGRVVKGFTCFYGVLSIAFAFLASSVQQNLITLTISIFGVIGGGILGVFTLGIFFHRSNSKGAIIGLVASMIIVTWIKLGSAATPITNEVSPLSIAGCLLSENKTANLGSTTLNTDLPFTTTIAPSRRRLLAGLYRLSYQYYGPLGLIISVAIGMIASGVTGFRDPTTVEPRLKLYLVDAVLCCLPVCLKDLVRRDGKQHGHENVAVSKTDNGVTPDEDDSLMENETRLTTQTSMDYKKTTWL